MRILRDTHTHRRDATDGVINYDPVSDNFPLDSSLSYSVGIHPWHAGDATPELMERVAALAANPSVVAVGETGLDSLRGPGLDMQREVFLRHIDIALNVGKTLIIHAVKAWPELLRIAALYPDKPAPWIVHGFRGKPGLARQLLAAGLSLSYGRHYNPESFAITPVDRRYAESDESSLPAHLPGEVSQIRLNVGDSRHFNDRH